jgi:demethylmenaquinone methyltransferase/2-methoxy-6-polyprenyl-1,4-benzoquinol methylase
MDPLLSEQIAYYRARADEYDVTALVHEEQERQLRAALDAFGPRGRVLELACGTGLWTGQLAAAAQSVTAVDASPEAIALNRRKVDDPRVQYVEADLFSWRPAERYDTVFFAAWLSHVPPDRFDAFWALVADCLAPAGRVFFVEDGPAVAAYERTIPGRPEYVVERTLLDGRTFRAVKALREPEWIRDRLSALGWDVDIQTIAPHFFHGTARRRPNSARSAVSGARRRTRRARGSPPR